MTLVAARQSERVRSVVMCGLSIALMAVSAWVTIPLGPVPFTLQILAISFVLFALKPSQALMALGCYILLGALGLPVFSSFRGGLGALMGPTGGFIIGMFVGACVALGVAHVVRNTKVFSSEKTVSFFGAKIRSGFLMRNVLIGVLFLLVVYLIGWFQLMMVSNLAPEVAFAVGVAPFVLIDTVKIIGAILLAQAVGAAVNLAK